MIKKRLTSLMFVPVLVAMCGLAASADPPEGQPQLPPGVAAHLQQAGVNVKGKERPEFPKFEDVAKDYTKVVSTADGQKSLYTVWTRKKDAQMLAELPRNHEKQLLFVAYVVSGGIPTAGVQAGDLYATWRRFDKRLALVEPNFGVLSTGDLESKKGRDRVFTDRVILDVPILCMGPGGGPVIDMDSLLVGQSTKFFGFMTRGVNPSLAKIAKAKAFPRNVEVAFEVPLQGGRFGTLAYSLWGLPSSTGYKPRQADERIGFFTTAHRDIGDAGADTQWIRYVNRWKLEKADPKLKLSPPREPIVFYLEHTTPVRYRRWVRDGVLEWNRAFEKVGILNAVEVYQQDARTGAHMEKDPEDARYNFVVWTNANMGFAIGPSRVHPKTGQILDADIVMDEGFIGSYVNAWRKVIPEQAMEGFGPQTREWLETRPQWDPRVRLAPPWERSQVAAQIQAARAGRGLHRFAHPAGDADPTLIGDDEFDGLRGRLSQVNGMCSNGMAKALDVALFRLSPDLFIELAAQDQDKGDKKAKADDEDDDDDEKDEADDQDEDEDEDEDADEDADDDDDDEDEDKDDDKNAQAGGLPDGDILDGVPDWFIGPLLKEVVMHEVGHTLGLRHNFKASTIRTLAEINTEEYKGKPQVGSVMDYNPININFEDGPVQGDYTQVSLGPYDYWAIEYGYTFEKDVKKIAGRVAEADLAYGTDEDTWGPDPRARRFDYGADPLQYAESQMRLVKHLRERILDRMVKDGESWAKAREGYEILLGRHFGAVAIAANWVGSSYVHRDKKGDPDARNPVVPVEVERQRRALDFVIASTFDDKAFGLTPELLGKMTVDKWWDDGGFRGIFEDESWPVHDRVAALQAVALTLILNPTTLNRVFDNEFVIPADQDALTVADVLLGVSDSVWSELAKRPTRTYTARKPMVSSLRRNLQAEHLGRLIDLTLPNPGFGASSKAVSNLSVHYLRQLEGKLDKTLDKYASKLDPYTEAHFAEAQVRIGKALDAQYIYNTDDIGGGMGGMPFIMFQPPVEEGGDR